MLGARPPAAAAAYHSAMQWLGFAAGLAIVILAGGSVIGTLVVPRRVRSVIARACDGLVDLDISGDLSDSHAL